MTMICKILMKLRKMTMTTIERLKLISSELVDMLDSINDPLVAFTLGSVTAKIDYLIQELETNEYNNERHAC